MTKLIIITMAILLAVTPAIAQLKVAGYAHGKPGTDKYERLEFWTKDGKQTEIYYAYGKDRKEVKLQFSGKDQVNGNSCFKVQFVNNYTLYIIPKATGLQVTDKSGKYNKNFLWEYEGPVNGIGTYCNVCAEDEDDALELIEEAYLK